MTTKRPAEARREETPGGRHSKRTASPGSLTARDLVDRLDLRARLAAIVDELDRLDADVDVPRCIAEGCLEDVDLLLAEEARP
jgi:hypothetical protein